MITEAARTEAERRWPTGSTGLAFPEHYAFRAGAEWAAAQYEDLVKTSIALKPVLGLGYLPPDFIEEMGSFFNALVPFEGGRSTEEAG